MSKKINAKSTETVVLETPKKKGWRIKSYFINIDDYNSTKSDLSKEPNQVQIMVNFFATKYVGEESATQGRIMCQDCIDNGGLKTVIEPHVLFAYYRSTMEKYGLKLRG